MNSDTKSLIKESLREAFYLKKVDNPLNESIDKKLTLLVGKNIKYPALITQNTDSESPYKLVWFSPRNNRELGYIPLTQMETILFVTHKNGYQEIIDRLTQILGQPTTVLFKYYPRKSNIQEELCILEQSLRQLDALVENKYIINESMTVYVEGAEYKTIHTLDSLCYRLIDIVLSPALHKVPQDQQEYFKKNGVGFYETITPDGSYWQGKEGSTGIINVYLSGFTTDLMKIVTRNIFYYLRQWKIKWKNPKIEQSGAYQISKVLRIPVVENQNKYSGPPELNMANVNAYQIFHNLLQYEGTNDFKMNPKELIERIVTVLRHDSSWIDKHIIKPTNSDWPEAERDSEEQPMNNPHMDVINNIGNQLGGPTMIGMGMSGDSIKERLQILINIARWAIEHGHDTIFVA